MANTRDIRIRIKGVKNTRQITRAMQMVATSKMKKAQENAKAGRPYALLLADMIVSIADEFEELTQSYFIQRPVKHRGILVIGTDKGLCGALNSNLFRVLNDVEDSAKFVSLGKRASQYLSGSERTCLPTSRSPTNPPSPTSEISSSFFSTAMRKVELTPSRCFTLVLSIPFAKNQN